MNPTSNTTRRNSTGRLALAMLLGVLSFVGVCVVDGTSAFAQQTVSVPTPMTRAKPGQTVPAASVDSRDVLLLLESGPIHLRLRLSLGGASLQQNRRQFVTNLIQKLDKDQDGKLTRAEASGSPLLRTKQRPGAEKFIETLKTQPTMSRRDIDQTMDRLGGELVAYRQDLSSSKNDIEVFKLFDKDNSGVLEDSELAAARDLILLKDTDGDECVAFQEFFPPPPPPDPNAPAPTTPAETPPTPLASVADMIRDTHEPLLPTRLLKKYDKKRDLQLDAAEMGWSAERVAAIDTDGNGKLNAAELTHLGEGTPDAELVVDLKAPLSDGGTLQIPQTGGKHMDDASRPDYAKVGFGSAVITFSLRNTDPVALAIENAMRQFNQLDMDGNGYVGKDETMLRTRFERGLFDLIDLDGDGKIFADEMKDYVRARSEPAATSCRMNVYDTGYGFFMALDANADGRVSVRETRRAAEALAELDRDGKPGIKKDEPVRHFHIEFTRGGYQLFGPSEQLVAQTPAFQQRRPSGPIWFRTMDRNNDGDLTWNEFLGPREIFHKLDADLDTLIDPLEAAKAK